MRTREEINERLKAANSITKPNLRAFRARLNPICSFIAGLLFELFTSSTAAIFSARNRFAVEFIRKYFGWTQQRFSNEVENCEIILNSSQQKIQQQILFFGNSEVTKIDH